MILDFLARSLGFMNPERIQSLIKSSAWFRSYLFSNSECSKLKASPVSITVVKPQYLQVAIISPGLNSTGAPQCEHLISWATAMPLRLQFFSFNYFPRHYDA